MINYLSYKAYYMNDEQTKILTQERYSSFDYNWKEDYGRDMDMIERFKEIGEENGVPLLLVYRCTWVKYDFGYKDYPDYEIIYNRKFPENTIYSETKE